MRNGLQMSLSLDWQPAPEPAFVILLQNRVFGKEGHRASSVIHGKESN